MFEIGSSLREARLRQGLEFPEIEQATKVRAKHLKALEDEQFELLPAQTYVKGFLRTYAEYLGLDGQLYVDEFNSRYAIGEEDPAPIARRSVGRAKPRVDSRRMLLVLLGIAGLTALVIAAVQSGGDDTEPVPRANNQPTSNEPPPPPRRKKQRQKPPAPKRATLVLTADPGASWIEVHVGSSAGRQLFQGTLEPGQTQRFRARRLWLNVGQPGSLTWTLNGKERPAPGTEVGVFLVTPSGIQSAPTTA